MGGWLLVALGGAWLSFWLFGLIGRAVAEAWFNVEIPRAVIAAAVVIGTATALGLYGFGVLSDSGGAPVKRSPRASFCDTHACIPNFYNGGGYIVQCADGMWSHSGGEPGACSYHGGEGG